MRGRGLRVAVIVFAVFGALTQQRVRAQDRVTSGTVRPLVGAIRWDAWYGVLPETVPLPDPTRYPGYDTTRTRVPSPDPGREAQRALAAELWRYRWPFFTELNADGSAKTFNENRAEVLEKEIDYAVHAGLDYWAFDAYPEDCPLSYTLKTFLACKTRDRIKFCLFLVMGSAYGRFADDEACRAYAARLIAEPNYLKVEGNRPVIYMGFLDDALVEKLADGRWQRFCGELAKGGAGKPYLVIGHGNPAAAKRYCARLGGEAVSDYNYSRGITREGMPFVEVAAAAESFWERCEAAGVSVVPICMAGFDWRPREMNPVSWHVCDQRHSKQGTPEELAVHRIRRADARPSPECTRLRARVMPTLVPYGLTITIKNKLFSPSPSGRGRGEGCGHRPH